MKDLYEVNKGLFETAEKLGEKLPELTKLEIEYESKYYDFLLNSKLSSAQGREAEAHKLIEQEDIFIKYKMLRSEVKALYVRKECLMAISSNLRNLSYGGDYNG